jgi:hypothetical protein
LIILTIINKKNNSNNKSIYFLFYICLILIIKKIIKMKKLVLLLAFAIMGTTAVNAQEVAAAKKEVKKEKKAKKEKAAKGKTEVAKAYVAEVEGAGMVFENETIDYGTIAHNADGTREFVLRNNGNKDLVITAVNGSCGCTVPTKPEAPIKPGEKGKISVHYATDRVGPISKSVTVTSNATGNETKVVYIKGTVLPDEAPVSPLTPKS